tara:strand:+ start:3463 stop:3744 length:282 start_codon:yes stop_codon:yes gene_type:complete
LVNYTIDLTSAIVYTGTNTEQLGIKLSHFSAHDLKVAFTDGTNTERQRMLGLLRTWLEDDNMDLSDIWEELSFGSEKPLTSDHSAIADSLIVD